MLQRCLALTLRRRWHSRLRRRCARAGVQRCGDAVRRAPEVLHGAVVPRSGIHPLNSQKAVSNILECTHSPARRPTSPCLTLTAPLLAHLPEAQLPEGQDAVLRPRRRPFFARLSRKPTSRSPTRSPSAPATCIKSPARTPPDTHPSRWGSWPPGSRPTGARPGNSAAGDSSRNSAAG